jgi:hypothetical protein
MGPSVPQMRPDAQVRSFKRGPQMAAICIAPPPACWGSRGPAKTRSGRQPQGSSASGGFGGFYRLDGTARYQSLDNVAYPGATINYAGASKQPRRRSPDLRNKVGPTHLSGALARGKTHPKETCSQIRHAHSQRGSPRGFPPRSLPTRQLLTRCSSSISRSRRHQEPRFRTPPAHQDRRGRSHPPQPGRGRLIAAWRSALIDTPLDSGPR